MTTKDINEFCAQARCSGRCESCKLLAPSIVEKFAKNEKAHYGCE